MIPQTQKNVFTFRILNSLNDIEYNHNIVRYVTFSARENKGYFGVIDGESFTEKLEGKILVKVWKELAEKFPNCILGDYVVKSDSFNGIIILDNCVPRENHDKYYFKILTYFKSRSTILLNKLHGMQGRIFWENNYREIEVTSIERLKEVLTLLRS